MSLPRIWRIENYEYVLTKTNFFLWILNSARNTLITLAFVLTISFVTGYFLSRFKFKGRSILYIFFMFSVLIPGQALMIPSYVLFVNAKLLDAWYTLPISYVAASLSIAIFLIESFIKGIPTELEEAAAIDGSSFSRTLFTIILPICVPILVTVGIMTFFAAWNEFMSAMIMLKKDVLKTIPLGLSSFQGQYATDYGRIMAGTTCAIFPVMIVYFFFSKKVMQGLMEGAIKG